MEFTGNLLKMKSRLGEQVEYTLNIGNDEIDMNAAIGQKITIHHNGIINCIHCGRATKKSFFQGYCYPCFKTLPQTDECILHPEKCQAHLGISRDMEWSKNNCLQEHFVYLSLTSGIKVGVTRKSQVPTRWIDQGAVKAIKVAITPNRYTAGLIEITLKEHMADKTNWRNMLKNKVDNTLDPNLEKQKIQSLLTEELKQFFLKDTEVVTINYPVKQYPAKVKSINLDKTEVFTGILSGIKGQYLIFDDGSVFNVRKHNGYMVDVKVG